MHVRKSAFQSLLWCAACLLLAAGCGNPGLNNMQRMVKASQKLADVYRSVHDEASAQAAIPELKPAYEEWIAAMNAAAEYEKKNGQVRALKTTITKLTADLKRLEGELKSETTRVRQIKGLPQDFWNVAREETYKLLAVTMKALQETHQPVDPAIVDLMLQASKMYEDLGAAKIVELSIDDSSPDTLDRVRTRLKEIIGPEFQMIQAPNPDNPRGKALAIGPVKDFDDFVAKIDFGTVTEKEKPRGDVAVAITRQKFEPPPAATEISPPESASFEVPPEHAAAVAKAREHMQKIEAAEKGLDPKDPKYHERLADLVKDEHAPHHDEAVNALLAMHPSDVADKQTRAKIARGFKDLALTTHFERRDACRGLVIWGGKYSVPILVQILDENKLGDNGPVFEALGDVGTAEGATAAARYLGEFFNHDKAASALRRMGAVAEDALIEVAPSDDEKVSLAAVNLLGDVGTPKSYPVLRQGARSRNPAVKDAALASIRKIRTREQAAKASGTPATK